MRKIKLLFFLFLLVVSFNAGAKNRGGIEAVQKIKLPGFVIQEVQEVKSGEFRMADGKFYAHLPEFTRVVILAKPSPDSNIRIEIWLPDQSWNGRFLGTGNGGGAGNISYSSLVSGIKRGFATANTDMGTSAGVYNILNNPERWADFCYRATHQMTVISKVVVKAFYGQSAGHSYFTGCSTGGQQALMEAQRYPGDYDGILAGGPANNRTHLHASFIWNLIAANPNGKAVLSSKKLELFTRLLLKNQLPDGRFPGDNYMTDPGLYHFQTDILKKYSPGCNPDSCFTEGEIAALKKIYEGPVNPRTGERIYSPLPFGGERLENTEPHLYPFFWVFGKDFDYTKFDFDQDMAHVDSVLGPVLNANNPNLKNLKRRGGKILMYTGTADQLVPYPDALAYYKRVIQDQGSLEKTKDFFRFFLVPGMGHCAGGSGVNEFGQFLNMNVPQDANHDILTALINWVEKDIAPDSLIATNFNCCDTINRIHFQRPIYPWPSFPEYQGGNPDLPSSYKGKEHTSGVLLSPDIRYLKY
jgi:feruloyl esterase